MGNCFINTHRANEQYLLESLINEAVQIHSEQFYYIPRSLFSPDQIFGEDRLSRFEHAYPIDGYLESSGGFEGQGYFIQKFGGVVDYSATITFTKRHWEQFVGRYGKTTIPNRPNEGDLIYYPLTDSLFEIKFVDDKNPFGQLGAFYTFKVTVETFDYSSEHINTEVGEIDVFESLHTHDQNPDVSLWGGITEVQIIDGGSGYSEPPTLSVESLTGSGAVLQPVLDDNGVVVRVDVLEPGDKYHSGDYIVVEGECTSPAILQCQIATVIENAGTRFASNSALIDHSLNNVFDIPDHFGGLSEQDKQQIEQDQDLQPDTTNIIFE